MKALWAVTALAETGTGAALMTCPSEVVTLLLGAPLDSANAFVLGRVAGAALLALGVASGLAWKSEQAQPDRGLISAMLIYNSAVAAILAYAGCGLAMVGIALWPAVLLHLGMAVWCVVGLKRVRTIIGNNTRSEQNL